MIPKRLLHRLAVMGGATVLLWAEAAHAAPQPETGWGMPRDVSEYGHLTDGLINVTLILISILFVIMASWLVLACVRYTSKHKAHYTHGDTRGSILATFAVAGVVFFGVDGNLFYNSTVDLGRVYWNSELPNSNPDKVLIEINAHQWAWDARYAGPDGEFNTRDDIVTLNDIRVPVGVPVIFQLASTDVIHSLYIPNVRVKQDIIPGNITWVWFQAKETGEFDIACAQHCGTHHYKMRGQLTILSREAYDAWATNASQISARAFDPDDEEAHWGWTWQEH